MFEWKCVFDLIQHYEFQGQPRVSIYLYSSYTYMNSLTKLGHQVDAELGAFSCAVTDVTKSPMALKNRNVKLEGGPTLISDSRSCISLCLRPLITLDLSTSLIVSRVQEVFTDSNLYFVPGKTFEQGVDQPARGIHSTGTSGLARKEKCLPIKTCLICGTAPLTSAS